MKSRLAQIAQKARAWRLAGDHHRGYDNDFPLIGKCFDNAYVARYLLENAGYNPYIVEGTTNRVADQLIEYGEDPSEFKSVDELGGFVHYWVVIPTEGGAWSVDIASDTHQKLGEIVVADTIEPNEYYHLPDSKAQGESIYQNAHSRGDRCQYCGDHQYTENGCPNCYGKTTADL